MKLFGQLIRTVVNVGMLPVALARDVVTLAGTIDNNGKPHLVEKLEQLKREAGEESDAV